MSSDAFKKKPPGCAHRIHSTESFEQGKRRLKCVTAGSLRFFVRCGGGGRSFSHPSCCELPWVGWAFLVLAFPCCFSWGCQPGVSCRESPRGLQQPQSSHHHQPLQVTQEGSSGVLCVPLPFGLGSHPLPRMRMRMRMMSWRLMPGPPQGLGLALGHTCSPRSASGG